MSVAVQAQTDLLSRDRDPALEGRQRVLSDLDNASLRYGRVYLLSRFEISDVAVEPEFVQGNNDSRLSLVGALPTRIYWVPRKKLAISADVTPSLGVIDTDNGYTTQAGYATRADLHLLTNSLYVDLYGGRSDELSPLPAEIGGVGTSRRNTIGADAEFKYSSKTSFLVTTSRNTLRFPDDRLQPVPDSDVLREFAFDENRYRATLLHKTLPRIALSLAGEARDYDFPAAQYESAKRREAALGATYNRRRMLFRVQGGPATLRFNDPRFRDFDGLVGSATGSVAVGRRWNFDAAVSRDAAFSSYTNNGYYMADGATLNALWTLTRRFSVHATPAVWRHNYDTPVAGIRRSDRIRQLLVGWTYTLPLLRFGVDVGDYSYSSNAVETEDSGIRVILRLSFSATRWFE